MSKIAITSPELAPPVGPFSQAIEAGGFIYLSGQVGQDPATGKVVEGGIEAETERVFQNLSAVLRAAGKSFDDVAGARVFLTNMSDYHAITVKRPEAARAEEDEDIAAALSDVLVCEVQQHLGD
ncbi:MAG TPA: Rid family hydrolase, partial [Thermoanaerobaculia bacterium]